MTSTPDLNISGSPIYEHLVASSGDPYQPPAYQPPALYEPPDAQGAAYGYGNPAMLSQFLDRILGDGQNWVAVVVFGGPMADQLRQSQQYQHQQFPQQQPPQPFWPAPATGYADAPSFGAMGAEQAALAQAYQAYQQMMMYQWAAQQQAASQQAMAQQAVAQQAMPQNAMAAGQQPLALTARTGDAARGRDGAAAAARPGGPGGSRAPRRDADAGLGRLARPDLAERTPAGKSSRRLPGRAGGPIRTVVRTPRRQPDQPARSSDARTPWQIKPFRLPTHSEWNC